MSRREKVEAVSLEMFSRLVVNGLGEDACWRELDFEDRFKR